MQRETAIFKALADTTRLRIVLLLSACGETCVCSLSTALDEPEYKISKHLGILRMSGLIEARRNGSWIYYRLCKAQDSLAKHLRGCFKTDFCDNPTVRDDLKRMKGNQTKEASVCHD